MLTQLRKIACFQGVDVNVGISWTYKNLKHSKNHRKSVKSILTDKSVKIKGIYCLNVLLFVKVYYSSSQLKLKWLIIINPFRGHKKLKLPN